MQTRMHSNTYLSFCVAAALIVMSVMLVMSNVNQHKFDSKMVAVSQDDATLLYLKHKWENAPAGSEKKLKAQKELDDEIAHRKHDDYSVYRILNLLFGKEISSTMLTTTPLPGADISCLKMMFKTYEQHCGTLSEYGQKYTRVFANMCDAGISEKQMIDAASQACPQKIK